MTIPMTFAVPAADALGDDMDQAAMAKKKLTNARTTYTPSQTAGVHVLSEGRTVLFVSHNMGAVKRLCPRALLLQQGRVQHWGPTGDVVRAYVSHGLGTEGRVAWDLEDAQAGDYTLRLKTLALQNPAGETATCSGVCAHKEMSATVPAATAERIY